MFFLLLLVLSVVTTNGLSIGTVSEKNVTKRVARASNDLFPDWVPFKNKHGEELGEFVQVETKSKPKKKKRLALPTNFIMRAVAEPEGDDYYDKGQGESDGEDYYEKKEWSDLNRPGEEVDSKKISSKLVNHTDISDIDGLVNIITKPSPVDNLLKNDKTVVNSTSNSDIKDTSVKNKAKEEIKEEKKVTNTKEEKEKKEEASEEVQASVESRNKDSKPQEQNDSAESDDDDSTEKRKAESEDKKESEAKKAKILNSVDELKQRHADEQREITERLKEEELYLEEHEKDKITARQQNKWRNNDEQVEHEDVEFPKQNDESVYDEYDEKVVVHDKYKINPPKKTKTTTKQPKRASKKQKNKEEREGKLSVFKNPKKYIVYDYDDNEEQPTTTTVKPRKTKKSRRPVLATVTTTTPIPTLVAEESVRISLVPDSNAKEGEPALFFPKRRKNRRRLRKKNKTPAIDSYVAETVDEKAKKSVTPPNITVSTETTTKSLADGTGLDSVLAAIQAAPSADGSAPSGSGPSAEGSAPSAQDAVSTNSKPVSDAVPAPSDHKKEEEKPTDYHVEKGGQRDYHSEHKEEHGEHGKKAYEGLHKDTKTSKGHHDKEEHLGKYDDNGGHDHHHHDEKGHYGSHHHEEHGKKHAKYEESGKHAKGHNTKGSHDVHKKEEYDKKVEFFEEEGDSGEEEKHGGHDEEHQHSSGGHFKKGGLDAGHHLHSKGDTAHFGKGGHVGIHKGHHGSGGHDGHGQQGNEEHHKESKDASKKWVYHHDQPAKTAHLVLIDRRGDRYMHGPRYYG